MKARKSENVEKNTINVTVTDDLGQFLRGDEHLRDAVSLNRT